MKVTAITRFKQGDLFALLEKLGWNQAELARRTGMNPSTVGNIINMRQRPSLAQARKIYDVFEEAGEFFDLMQVWPEHFKGFPIRIEVVQTQELTEEQLEGYRDYLQVKDAQSGSTFTDEQFEAVEVALKCLSPIKRFIVEERSKGKTLAEIASATKRTRGGVDQMYKSALRKIRNRIGLNFKREQCGVPLLTGEQGSGEQERICEPVNGEEQ